GVDITAAEVVNRHRISERIEGSVPRVLRTIDDVRPEPLSAQQLRVARRIDAAVRVRGKILLDSMRSKGSGDGLATLTRCLQAGCDRALHPVPEFVGVRSAPVERGRRGDELLSQLPTPNASSARAFGVGEQLLGVRS